MGKSQILWKTMWKTLRAFCELCAQKLVENEFLIYVDYLVLWKSARFCGELLEFVNNMLLSGGKEKQMVLVNKSMVSTISTYPTIITTKYLIRKMI